MADNKFSFSKAVLSKLPAAAAGKRAYYYDTKVHGLGLAVTATGTKSFVLYRKINGKPERIHLGRYPDVELEEARARAHELNAAIERGENPNDEKRLARAEWTLGGFFQIYLSEYAKLHKKSWAEDEAQFRRYVQAWAERKLSSFAKAELQALHSQIGRDHGHYAANRLLALFHSLFEKAREWGWAHPNPAQDIKKFTERSRERFLQPDELPRFFQALAEETHPHLKDYVLLSLFTGARKSNVLGMRWQDLNLQQATWLIPETKNGSSQLLPLMPEALLILQQRRSQYGQTEFVFPARSQTGRWMEPQKAWWTLLDRAGIDNLRLHDLRRSLGSWQAVTGASTAIIGKTLNHKSLAATEIYARLNLDPIRAAMETATRAMLEHATPVVRE